MTRLVRARHRGTRHEYTVSAEEVAIDPQLEVIDQPATDVNGAPLPPKPRQHFGSDQSQPKPAPKEGK